MPDHLTVTVTETTTKTFEIEPHELAEHKPEGHATHDDLHSLAIDIAERADSDTTVEVHVEWDRDGSDLFLAATQRYINETE